MRGGNERGDVGSISDKLLVFSSHLLSYQALTDDARTVSLVIMAYVFHECLRTNERTNRASHREKLKGSGHFRRVDVTLH